MNVCTVLFLRTKCSLYGIRQPWSCSYADYLCELGQVNSLDSLPSLSGKHKQPRQFRTELVRSPPPTFPKEWLKGFLGFSSTDAVWTIETEGRTWGQFPSFQPEALLLICFIYHFYISFPRRMGSKAKHKKMSKP